MHPLQAMAENHSQICEDAAAVNATLDGRRAAHGDFNSDRSGVRERLLQLEHDVSLKGNRQVLTCSNTQRAREPFKRRAALHPLKKKAAFRTVREMLRLQVLGKTLLLCGHH